MIYIILITIIKMNYNCDTCGIACVAKSKYIPGYCDVCQIPRKQDIMELILPDSVIQYQDHIEAEQVLANLTANVRLDLHNVLDTVAEDYQLPYDKEECCCISFVGQTSSTRVQAKYEMIRRIESGQIKFGALVFARGNRRRPQEASTFTKIGSKAWFNMHVKATSSTPIFIDDSEDHIDSVQYALPHFNCVLLKGKLEHYFHKR